MTATNISGTSGQSNYSNYITVPMIYKSTNVSKFNQQIAYNINKKKYYESVIINNNIKNNEPFSNYTPQYYKTSYNSIYSPNISNVPY